jgi:hypothetical protein
MAVEKAANPAHPIKVACGPDLAASTAPVTQPDATPLYISFFARY